MKSLSQISLFGFATTLAVMSALHAGDGSFHAPDSLVLKNGQVVQGLIIRNSVDSVLIQEKHGEHTYPKSEIVRIRDEDNRGKEMTRVIKPGQIPPWRIIANDLRTLDSVKSLIEVPAILIDNGVFKNVPYKSFRINRDLELNIYGDPENPAGIELGIYGGKSGNPRLRRELRGYLAGYVTSRDEVTALYSVPLDEGIRRAGNLTFETTPKTAPDAFGAWWISVFNERALNRARLSDAEYAKLTRPASEVIEEQKHLGARGWSQNALDLNEKLSQLGDSTMVLLRGFYRDKNGDFRLIGDKNTP